MTETDWEWLRTVLVAQFDEDVVQQVLVRLLETQAGGVEVLDPLHWCRRAAARVMKNEYRRRSRQKDAHETLSVLRIPLDNRSTKDVARDKKRRQRRKTA